MKTNNQEKQEAATAMIVLESLKKEAAPLMKKLERIDLITSKEHYANAMAQMKLLKDLGKAAKEKEKSLTDPLKQVVGDIQQLFKPFLTKKIMKIIFIIMPITSLSIRLACDSPIGSPTFQRLPGTTKDIKDQKRQAIFTGLPFGLQ